MATRLISFSGSGLDAGRSWRDTLNYFDALYTVTVGPDVPEASTWGMMLLGFAGLGFVGYRKTRTDNALA